LRRDRKLEINLFGAEASVSMHQTKQNKKRERESNAEMERGKSKALTLK
jgi:hypothetical protein